MALELQILRHLDVTVMQFTGRLTQGGASKVFRDAVRDAVWEGHRKLALDYGAVFYQDSTGIGEMVSAFTTVGNSGGELILFALTKRVRDFLQITKLYGVFRVVDSRDSALTYFDSTRKPEIRVTARRYFHVSVLAVEGALTETYGASKVSAAIETALSSGAESVIVLCRQVLEIDRAGVETLLVAQRDVRKRGGDMVLTGLEDRLLPQISEPALSGDLQLCGTVDAAFGVFGLRVDRSGWKIEVSRAG